MSRLGRLLRRFADRIDPPWSQIGFGNIRLLLFPHKLLRLTRNLADDRCSYINRWGVVYRDGNGREFVPADVFERVKSERDALMAVLTKAKAMLARSQCLPGGMDAGKFILSQDEGQLLLGELM